jgi:hypothetical protein
MKSKRSRSMFGSTDCAGTGDLSGSVLLFLKSVAASHIFKYKGDFDQYV